MSEFYFDDDFDDSVAPSSGADFTPVPKGKYRVMIVESDRNPSKSGAGQVVKLKLQILADEKGSEEFGGRTIYDYLNVVHVKPSVQEGGQKRMMAYRHATGYAPPKRPTKSSDLHEIPFWVEVIVEKDKNTDRMNNRVKEILFDQQTPAPPPSFPTQPQSAPKPAQGKSPWAK